MAAPRNIPTEDLPKWLENITFHKAIKAQIGDYQQVNDITIEYPPSTENENCTSLLISLKAKVKLEDNSIKTAAFILKTHHNHEAMTSLTNRLRLFVKEEDMYHKILPKFEQLYQNAGKDLQFAPKIFKFDNDLGEDYVFLEDLQLKQFKHANRLEGLDMEHMKEVLQKMAEFHAASACYVEHYGMFGEDFTVGVFSEKNKSLLKEFNKSQEFLNQLKKWKNCQQYYEKLSNSDDYLVDRLLQDQKVNLRQFNVLNHGDLWTNNILFQYDAFGKIKNTLFLDFQVSKYGSPANDLYYLILSSARKDIKIAQFDYMIHYYYDRLIENLKLLQYHRPLPKFQHIHEALLRHGLAAYLVVSKVLPVVMMDKNLQTNKSGSALEESKIKSDMYGNHKYSQAMMDLLPWLDNRGLLDWK